MKDKILVVLVTRNNPVLLRHVLDSYKKYDAGYDHDILIADNSSTERLEGSGKGYICKTYPNDRVEVTFDKAWRDFPDYKYYFFVHDDAAANHDGWLKVFVDRMNSGYSEDIIKDSPLKDLPIGKVGACTQFWRSYNAVMNYPVQCLFLEKALEILIPGKVPPIFKYTDNDRVLVSNSCLSSTQGLRNLGEFKLMETEDPDKYKQLCEVLGQNLNYHDEGIPPRDLYPAGYSWNKFTMFSEFLTSIDTLVNGHRIVGLEGDGYLEQVHGYDELWGHKYIHHYGAPNFKQTMGRILSTDAEEIGKHFKERAFLVRCDNIVKQYFERKQ